MCCVYNFDDSVGTTSHKHELTPTQIFASGVTGVSGTHGFTCAVVHSALQCWGAVLNSWVLNAVPSVVVDSGVEAFASVPGQGGGCFIQRGALRCWQDSSNFSTSADGKTTLQNLITVIDSGVQALAPSGNFKCAIVMNSLQCLGGNENGQIGDGTTVDSPFPKTIFSSGVTQVAAANGGACAVVSGSLQCWGLIAAVSGTALPAPKKIISSGVTSLALSYGGETLCARVNGVINCMGRNSDGELGRGYVDSNLAPTKANGITGAVKMSLGRFQSCFVTQAGSLDCLGVYSFASSASHMTWISSGVTDVKLNQSYGGCAIADGALKCWGDNSSGQVGTGSANSNDVITTVIPSGVVALDLQYSHGIALKNDGSVWYFGSIQGLPSTKVPLKIVDSGAIKIKSATFGFFVLMADGRLLSTTSSGLGQFMTGVKNFSIDSYPALCAVMSADTSVLCGWPSNGAASLQKVLSTGGFSASPVTSGAKYYVRTTDGALVLDGKTLFSSGVQSDVVEGPNYQSCVIVNGDNICWPSNDFSKAAVDMKNVSSFQSSYNACRIHLDGTVTCSGENYFGETDNTLFSSEKTLKPIVSFEAIK